MGGVAHHRHCPETIAAAGSLLDGAQRLYRQVRFDIRIDKALRQTERDDESSFGQAHGELLAITADEQILLGKFLEELFALDLHKEHPQSMARARDKRIDKSDLLLRIGN